MRRIVVALAMAAVAARAPARAAMPSQADSATVVASDSLSTPLARSAHPDTLTAQIEALDSQGSKLPPVERRVFTELLAAARELLADGDAEAAAIVIEDARGLVAERRE